MKIPTTLLGEVLLDVGISASLSVERDVLEIARRFEHEGMSFLTITLPSLDDALTKGLAEGRIAPTMFPGFKPWKRGGKLPALLSGFFMRVFDRDGSLLEHPCIDAIRAIRQVSRFFKKVLLPCSAARVNRAFERYVTNDESVNDTSGHIFWHDSVFASVCGYLWSDLEDLSGELYCSPGVFGTGATAEFAKLNERNTIRFWPERSENSFPLSYHSSHREDDYDSFSGIELLSSGSEHPVRVVSVPKTLKTPRVISVEPSYMMLMQKSIAMPLMNILESGRLGFRSIRFSDQSENRRLAQVGSIDGSLATIDLSDASDLVSNDLVKSMFRTCPTFLDLIQDCRSTKAQLRDGTLVHLSKFASMGSALCFPVEAMAFFSLVMTALVRYELEHNDRVTSLSRRMLQKLSKKVAIYGDDIIIPAETAPVVMAYLESNGLRVNHDKSFYTGHFRESCGGDFYKGHDVSPVYLRRMPPQGNKLEGSELSSLVSTSNQFYLKGNWHVAQWFRDLLDTKYRVRLARSTAQIGCLTWTSVIFDTRLRWDPNLCGWRVRGPSLLATGQVDPVLDIRAGMLACFGPRAAAYAARTVGKRPDAVSVEHQRYFATIGDGEDVFTSSSRSFSYEPACLISQEDRLDKSVKPYALKTKRRWTPTKVGITF